MTDNLESKNNTQDLQGDVIKDIFKQAEKIADLHTTLTSPRGDYFRKKLMAKLAKPMEEKEVEQFCLNAGVREYKRHLHKLIKFGLVSKQEKDNATNIFTYMRTYEGEEAVNIVRELERKLEMGRTKKILQAALGQNSIRLFLKVYGNPKSSKPGEDIIYTPLEIGQISTFLPRTIEGISAIDKLDDAGLVSYIEEGNIHVNPRRSTAFYQYLKALHQLLAKVSE